MRTDKIYKFEGGEGPSYWYLVKYGEKYQRIWIMGEYEYGVTKSLKQFENEGDEETEWLVDELEAFKLYLAL